VVDKKLKCVQEEGEPLMFNCRPGWSNDRFRAQHDARGIGTGQIDRFAIMFAASRSGRRGSAMPATSE
jgi:hypothetical protein